MTIKIALIGDYSPQVTAHVAIPEVLRLAATVLKSEVEDIWLGTETIESNLPQLSDFDGLWCVPASPYKSMDGALRAIKFARENKIPFLGTCGGFQHAVIEFTRHALGFTEADHAESNPAAAMPVMSPLACSLIEAEDAIILRENSRARKIYGANVITEKFRCSYGLSSNYSYLFEKADMKITGTGASGEARVVEIDDHPFFIATLFQPERSAISGRSHPLVAAFLQAAESSRRERTSGSSTQIL